MMKSIVKRIAGAALAAVLCLNAGALAEPQVFELVNVYGWETTQPGLSEAQKEALVKKSPGWSVELDNARYELEEAAFDGCTAYLLFRVTPKDPEGTLLISAYGWDKQDTIPGSEETFAERAERENRRLVSVGVSVQGLGKELNGSAVSGEKYMEDGSLLLMTSYCFKETKAGECEHRLCAQEYSYGDENAKSEEKTLILAPTAQMTIGRSEETFQTQFGTIAQVELRRSELGTFAVISGTLEEKLTEAQKEALKNQMASLWLDGDTQIPGTGGNLELTGKDGNPVFPDDAQGGEQFAIRLVLPAGEKMPEKVLLKLFDSTLEKQEGQKFTVTLQPVSPEA